MVLSPPELSIIVPCYNEAENLPLLLSRLTEVLASLPVTYEIIHVNDGSRDNTLQLLIEYHRKDPPIKVINPSRNFGKEIAMTAGLDYATDKAVIPIDVDLQEPPELIVQLVAQWRVGYDVVDATLKSREGFMLTP